MRVLLLSRSLMQEELAWQSVLHAACPCTENSRNTVLLVQASVHAKAWVKGFLLLQSLVSITSHFTLNHF